MRKWSRPPLSSGPVRARPRLQQIYFSPTTALADWRNTLSVLSRILTGLFVLPAALSVAFAQAPAITAGGTVNAASNAAGTPVSAGSLVSIYGSNFAAGILAASTVPLSTTIGSTSVTMNGIPAPLDFVSGGQINAEVPFNVLPAGTNGSVNVVVTNNGVASAPQPVVINQAGPAIFGDANLTPFYAIAYFGLGTDPRFGTEAWPPNTIPGYTTNLAKPGDLLTILATGLGGVTPTEANGSAPSYDPGTYQNHNTVATPTVLIGNVQAQVLFSGLAPQFPGVYQINVYVPQIPAGNAVPIQIQVGTALSPPAYIGVGTP